MAPSYIKVTLKYLSICTQGLEGIRNRAHLFDIVLFRMHINVLIIIITVHVTEPLHTPPQGLAVVILYQPTIPERYLMTCNNRYLRNAATTIWNYLPTIIRNCKIHFSV